MKNLLRAVVILGALSIVGFFVARSQLSKRLERPILKAATITVKKGSSFKGMLQHLEDEGVIHSARLVGLAAKINHIDRLQTGVYELHADDTIAEALQKFGNGKVILERFTIAEGLNRWQIRDLLAKNGWIKKSTFDALCDDKNFLEKNSIPGPSCEGYIFPETYSFAQGATPERIFSTIFSTYKKNYAAAIASGNGPMHLAEKEFMTLASIVEKETGAAKERPRIACVFYNRLQAKPQWRMETDPTVIYAAHLEDPNFDGNIKRYHLRQMQNPYNTYKNTGLPPGPIASPGRAAMDAVAHPISCGDFFFVSKNNGEHIFCPSLECHETAVQKWQIEYFRKKRAR